MTGCGHSEAGDRSLRHLRSGVHAASGPAGWSIWAPAFDRITFDLNGYEWIDYDWSSGSYVDGEGPIDTVETYTAFSPRIGVVFNVSEPIHLYGNISTGTQTPTSDELDLNPDLEPHRRCRTTRSDSRRAGRTWHPGHRGVLQPGVGRGRSGHPALRRDRVRTTPARPRKRGWRWRSPGCRGSVFRCGGSYTYSDFTFKEFSEPAFGHNVDRSGNSLPYIPKHYYSLFAAYIHRSGAYVRATANTWGEYWMDNANSEMYEGYDLVTDLTVG